MLLDKYCLPYDFTEVHTIRIKGNLEAAFRAVNEVSLGELSFIVRLLFSLRALPERIVGRNDASLSHHGSMLAAMYKSCFTMLTEQPPREIVFGRIVPGNIGRVWQKSSGLNVPIKDADEFLAFKNPDFLWVVANLLVKDAGTPGYVIVSTESRTRALSPQARKSFAPYWLLIRPFSGLIRRLWLRAIKRRVERELVEPVSNKYPGQAHS